MGWIAVSSKFHPDRLPAVRLGAGDPARLLHSGDPALCHLIEFKLTTLAGFVLIPFGLFALRHQRLVLSPSSSVSVRRCSAVHAGFGGADADHRRRHGHRAARAFLLGLGIFGPGIANGSSPAVPSSGAGAGRGTLVAGGGAGADHAAGRGLHWRCQARGAIPGGAAAGAGIPAYSSSRVSGSRHPAPAFGVARNRQLPSPADARAAHAAKSS